MMWLPELNGLLKMAFSCPVGLYTGTVFIYSHCNVQHIPLGWRSVVFSSSLSALCFLTQNRGMKENIKYNLQDDFKE